MHVFVYGTLLHETLFRIVAGPGDGAAFRKAWLDEFVVERAAGTCLPMLCERTEARADGVIWFGLSQAQRERLEGYEVPFGYTPVMRDVRTEEGDVPALVFFPPPAQQSSGESWDFGQWTDAEADKAIYAAEELDLHVPRLRGADMVRQWPMIAARAWSRDRAGRGAVLPAFRHVPAPGDWSCEVAAPLAGSFFKLATMRIGHRRFDGEWERGLLREVLVGVDAALLLPYDPCRDRVMLIEQFRAGPARRGDPYPWTLEPVAGIVDAGEGPDQAARREAGEEAGLNILAIERMFGFYPSPGSDTDYFTCFVGLCDLVDHQPLHGGLAGESEDIRLHVMSRQQALTLVDNGEVTTGPLVAMLFWLDRQAARLRHSYGSGQTP